MVNNEKKARRGLLVANGWQLAGTWQAVIPENSLFSTPHHPVWKFFWNSPFEIFVHSTSGSLYCGSELANLFTIIFTVISVCFWHLYIVPFCSCYILSLACDLVFLTCPTFPCVCWYMLPASEISFLYFGQIDLVWNIYIALLYVKCVIIFFDRVADMHISCIFWFAFDLLPMLLLYQA